MRLAIWALCAVVAPAQSVVISQVYGGGGNAGSVWRNDFVELFNRGGAPVAIDGWTVQYAGATATSWQSSPVTGTIEPGRYYLIQLAAGAGGTRDLPAPDATGALALGATSGKVRLVAPERVMDLVGYGLAANEFETAPVRDLSNTTAALRGGNGCLDSGNNAADFTIAAPNPRNSATARVDCDLPPPPAERLRISAIQGPGEASPHENRRVVTRGIVYARRASGFYIQSAPGDEDDDERTSEGLLVFTPVEAQVGTLVEVTGTVVEFRPAADPLSPPLTELIDVTVEVLESNQTLPAPRLLTGTDWERFEGMGMMLPVATVCGPSVGAAFFVATGPARPFKRPGLNGDDPGVLRAVAPSAVSLRAGQSVAGLVGPLDFGQRRYTMLLGGPFLSTTTPGLPAPPPPVPPAASGEFTIASLNLFRLFTTAADFEARIGRLKSYIQTQLRSPDILAVQEAGSAAALERLAAELGGYMVLFGATNDPSGIAPGFLVKRSTVTVTTAFPIDNPIHDRQPYRLNARVGGVDIAVVNLHMRSLTGIEDPAVQAKRRAQAENVNFLLRNMIAENVPFAITGDFNAMAFDDGYADLIAVMTQGTNLLNVNPRLKNGDNYSYVFSGQTQALDHMLVSPRLPVTRVVYARGNADFPDTERASDHDAIVGYFHFAPPAFTALSVTSAATYQSGSIAPGEIVTIFGAGLTAAQFTVDGRPARTYFASPTQWTIEIPADVTNGRLTHGATTVDIPLARTAPALFDTRPTGVPGQPVELWGTGGSTNVAARACGLPAEVLYSGANLGLWQVNIKVPERCPAGDMTVEVSSGTRTSNAIGLKLQAQ
ncbi:MAG: hypothetical protein FJW30_15580 [Acidobacteria bacterium]|nr:hypothetical protein [Acidobacteriota bacterium]